jgi:hypothetical protein
MDKGRQLLAALALGAVLAGPADLWAQVSRWLWSTLDTASADSDKGGYIDPNSSTGDAGGYIDPNG